MPDSLLSIFAAYTKPSFVPECDFITPIQVGRELSTVDLGFQSDNIGDNISAENANFNELTGLYWIWKHLDEIPAKYLGLAHYRRHFTLPLPEKKPKLFGRKKKVIRQEVFNELLNEASLSRVTSPALKQYMIEQLGTGAVIVPAAATLLVDGTVSSVKTQYIYNHIREDWHLIKEVVCRLYPEYEAFWDTFETGTSMYCFNMFVADKEFIRNYSAWLFNILFELKKVVKLTEYPYQRRVFGFAGERLLNLYLKKNQIKTAEFPVIFFYQE